MKNCIVFVFSILLALGLIACDIPELMDMVSEDEKVEEHDQNSDEQGVDEESPDGEDAETAAPTESDSGVQLLEDSSAHPQGVFYKIEEGSNTVYLFGSIHVGVEDLYPLHDSIESAFAESDYIAVEVDISNINELEAMAIAIRDGIFLDGRNLKNKLGEEAFEGLVSLTSEYGLPLNETVLNYMKPWVAKDLLTTAMVEEAGLQTEYGIDLYFLERATDDSMEIIALETMREQLEVIQTMSDEAQAADLAKSIEEFDEGVEELSLLMELWIDGDIEAISAMRHVGDDATEEYREYIKALTDDRDVKMAEKIEEFILGDNNDTYFVVVGAMHLVGENSVVDLLTKQGYNVVPAAGG
ncbi:TraB/GumN family protein [Evansella cellulosilytica]|uniref:GumN family protein n=1 Tax=Evansella cellulosilytica (strain ATCC 21833 / DSM 2522 / FERM P-1141 / JCM 9156 / N-4) TaxID=649639 RepID=E6TRR1_EVAC2|nr:TraB/GumN family protein [Evansella cellulosilytica]ADU29434.1 GumN family protein [Evansella cellulosilytica DSM 2522]